MRTKLRIMFCLLAVAALAIWICYQPALAEATVDVQTFRMPQEQYGFIPGIGDYYIQYEVHVVAKSVMTPSGRVNLSTHTNVDHFGGYVLPDGPKLQGAQSVGEHYNYSDLEVPAEFTFTVAFAAITRGSAANVVSHVTVHVTVNANGEVTAMFSKIW